MFDFLVGPGRPRSEMAAKRRAAASRLARRGSEVAWKSSQARRKRAGSCPTRTSSATATRPALRIHAHEVCLDEKVAALER